MIPAQRPTPNAVRAGAAKGHRSMVSVRVEQGRTKWVRKDPWRESGYTGAKVFSPPGRWYEAYRHGLARARGAPRLALVAEASEGAGARGAARAGADIACSRCDSTSSRVEVCDILARLDRSMKTWSVLISGEATRRSRRARGPWHGCPSEQGLDAHTALRTASLKSSDGASPAPDR